MFDKSWFRQRKTDVTGDRRHGAKRRRNHRLRFEPLEPRLVLDAGPLLISEFLAVNDGITLDQDGDPSDWIEIHNPTDAAVDLDGWYLTDDAAIKTKWEFPAVSLEPGGYLTVYASAKNRTDAADELHTNFKLDSAGEYLGLVRPDMTVSQELAPTYPEQASNTSYGFLPNATTLVDQGSRLTYQVPTPADAASGTDWTTDDFDDAEWYGSSRSSPLLITEVSTLQRDWLEIQNVSDYEINTEGWIALANDAQAREINNYHPTPWELDDSMSPGKVLRATDDTDDGSDYWGKIYWRTYEAGWAMILDSYGNVIDFLVWGYDADAIAGFEIKSEDLDIPFANFHITAADLPWEGEALPPLFYDPAIPDPQNTLQRSGTSDHNSAADFAFAPNSTEETANPGMTLPFPNTAPLPLLPGIGYDTSSNFDGEILTDVETAMRNENTSLWTRIAFDVEDPLALSGMSLQMKYNDGFVAYLNGQEIARSNAPATPAWNSIATATRTVEQSLTYEEFDVTEHLSALLPGNNTLAIHGLNTNAGDGNFLLQPKLVAGERGAERHYTTMPTPGGPNVSAVVINEIHFDPIDNARPTEFIELYNPMLSSVDVSGWRLDAGVEYTFDPGTIIPGNSYLIVAADPDVLEATFGVAALGPWLGRLENDGERVALRSATGATIDEADYRSRFPWPIASDGTGSSMELIHHWMDNDLGGSWRPSGYNTIKLAGRDIDLSEATPTPGARNSVWSVTAPPQIRQVDHEVTQPLTGESNVITAKVTDPDGVDSVELRYQIVQPGRYIPAFLPLPISTLVGNPTRLQTPNPEFIDPANWTTLVMVDDGTGGDEVAGDDVYTAVVPAQVRNRTLVRYRIVATDTRGDSITAPHMDDHSLNFAYYVYDGVPDYVATTRSVHPDGAGHVYDTDVMTSLPVYSLITRAADMAECYAYDGADQLPHTDNAANQEARRTYNWEGAFVYDGEVYDHVGYRLRGANGRYYGAGKRAMKFHFNRGDYFQAKGLDGEDFPSKWSHLTVGKMFGNKMVGDFGITELLNNELWNLIGVPAADAHWFHFRVVDGPTESPTGSTGQYYGDFWGMFFAFERYDVRFLENHDVPEGNLYKLSDRIFDGKDQQRYQAPDAVTNAEDYENIRWNANGSASVPWLRQYVGLEEWYWYHTMTEAIRHYDVFSGANSRHNMKNMAWYFYPNDLENNPNGQVWFLPYDTDDTWGPYWNTGHDHIKAALYDNGGEPELKLEYRNVIREFRDLVWQQDVINPWIDRLASIIDVFSMADRDRWRSAPASAGSQDFGSLSAKVADMKRFAFVGGNWGVGGGGRAAYLDSLANAEGDSSRIPRTPTISYVGEADYPSDALAFRTSNFSDPQGSQTFGAMEWRIGEITDPTAPAYDPNEAHKFEFTAVWESGELTSFNNGIDIPAGIVAPGHTYRVRVRMQDNTGRWGHWSTPLEMTVANPLNPVSGGLRITEIMYHPTDPTPEELAINAEFNDDDFEFIELQNTSDNTIDLAGMQLIDGVLLDFTETSLELAPGELIVVAKNIDALAARYEGGIRAIGPFEGRLDNGGEQIVLVDQFGRTMLDFEYNDSGSWPGRADGKGSSLEVLDPAADYNDSENWRSSAEYGGTPGAVGEGPRGDVLINEVLTHTDLPDLDAIELVNTTDQPINIGGWYLSDSAARYAKYRIADGTSIPAHGYLVFDENQFNPTPNSPGSNDFAMNSAHGDDVWLVEMDSTATPIRFVDHVEFGAAANGESFGRTPDAEGPIYPMLDTSLGQQNTGPRVGPLLITEVMYFPEQVVGATPLPDEMEFVEIYNPTGSAIDLTNWRIRKGVDYDFAAGVQLASGDTLVAVSFDPTDAAMVDAFQNFYRIGASVTIVGPYSGQLRDTGERVQLQRPDQPPADELDFIPHLLEDEVFYGVADPWPEDAAGLGQSLQRLGLGSWGHDVASWAAAVPTPGEFEVNDDSYEPNNALADAYTAGFDWQQLSLIAGPAMQADDDWYAIDVPVDHRRLTVDLAFAHALGNIDLAIVDATGQQVAASTGDTDNEQIDAVLHAPGTWLIKVSGDNAGNMYDLSWNSTYVHPGDADLSGATDLSDFNIWNANKFTAGTTWQLGDFNGDGSTDLSDFNIWNAFKFTSSAAPAPLAIEVSENETGALDIAIEELALLREMDQADRAGSSSDESTPARRAVDRLLATYWD